MDRVKQETLNKSLWYNVQVSRNPCSSHVLLLDGILDHPIPECFRRHEVNLGGSQIANFQRECKGCAR